MRHSATRALFERDDVIIVASVSCIYGIGSPEIYARMTLTLQKGPARRAPAPAAGLVELQYKRNDLDFNRGTFRVRGDTSRSSRPISRTAPGGSRCSATRSSRSPSSTRSPASASAKLDQIRLYPNSHYVTPKPTLQQAVEGIKDELKQRLEELPPQGQAARGAAARAAHQCSTSR